MSDHDSSVAPLDDAQHTEATRPRPRRLPKTPLALAILVLLAEHPMHPYEMKQLMRSRGHVRVFKLKNASLYDMVARLAALELIGPVAVGRAGRRPERTVYAITDEGREELRGWLADLTSTLPAEYPPLAAPLMFIYALGKEPAIAALAERAARLEAEIAGVDAYQRALRQGSDAWTRVATEGRLDRFPRLFVIEEEYAQTMRRAELAWLRSVVEELSDGTLAWPDPDTLPSVDKPVLGSEPRAEEGE